MQRHGLVDQVDGARDAWEFTDVGWRMLRVAHTLSHPVQMLKPRAGAAIEECTTFALLCLLHSDQWSIRVFVRSKIEPKPLPYYCGQPTYLCEAFREEFPPYVLAGIVVSVCEAASSTLQDARLLQVLS